MGSNPVPTSSALPQSLLVGAGLMVIVISSVPVQPLASVTVTVQVPSCTSGSAVKLYGFPEPEPARGSVHS